MLKEVTIVQSSVTPGDPHTCSDSHDRNSIVYSIYEALVKPDHAGSQHPSLAESWTVQPDQRTWRFKLREDAVFHNGEKLTAKDVAASLTRVVDPSLGGAYGTQGVYASYIGDATFNPAGEYILEVKTGEPMADLLDLLAEMPIAPESTLDRLPDEYTGTGPWQVADMDGSEMVMKPFKQYRGSQPDAESLTWRSVKDPEERADMVRRGEAHIASRIGVEGKNKLTGSVARVVERTSGLCVIFMFNAAQGACKDPRVRQALNYGLDVPEIIETIKRGAAEPLSGYVAPQHFGYNPDTPPYSHDPAKARRLLAQAGHPDGIKLVMDVPTSMPDEAPALAAEMAEQYRESGITLELKMYEDRAAYADMVRAKRINDLCCFDSSPRSTFRVLREKIHSGHEGPWWQGYGNPRVNELIDRAQRTFDDAERRAVYREVFTLVQEDAPWIFLYRPIEYWAVSGELPGWKPTVEGFTRVL